MTNAQLARRTAVIAKIAAQYTQELTYGMDNPHFCAADAEYAQDRFVEEIDKHLAAVRRGHGD